MKDRVLDAFNDVGSDRVSASQSSVKVAPGGVDVC
jgi:hypothetical protein